MSFSMVTPSARLNANEHVLFTTRALRKKGIFGNRVGELYVTDTRVAFVKAIMAGPVVELALNGRLKPMITFDRGAITKIERQPWKKQVIVTISDPSQTESFTFAPSTADALMAVLQPATA